jgi:hypothetical protein
MASHGEQWGDFRNDEIPKGTVRISIYIHTEQYNNITGGQVKA